MKFNLQSIHNAGILLQDDLGIVDTLFIQLMSKLRIGDSQNLSSQQGCVGTAVDGHSGNGDAGGHLNCGKQGIHTVHAAALALKSVLGLTCDPVAGLVEVPCIKRNVMGAVTAFTSADMALAGIKSAIPPDEVIDAMGEIGSLLPKCLRETSEAGLAVMPTAVKITKELKL